MNKPNYMRCVCDLSFANSADFLIAFLMHEFVVAL